ncbi:MAG: hypothetical protein Q9160_007428 [Pyrenula sp. 1 TL-2023]
MLHWPNCGMGALKLDLSLEYLASELHDLRNTVSFSALKDRKDRVDYILLEGWLESQLLGLDYDVEHDRKTESLLGAWARGVVQLCEERKMRMEGETLDAREVGGRVNEVCQGVADAMARIASGGETAVEKSTAFPAVQTVDALQGHLREWFSFHNAYDPLSSRWVAEPYAATRKGMGDLSQTIREKVLGTKTKGEDDDVGRLTGRQGLLLANLLLDRIPQTLVELVFIGESESERAEGLKIVAELDQRYGSNWSGALEERGEIDRGLSGWQPLLV